MQKGLAVLPARFPPAVGWALLFSLACSAAIGCGSGGAGAATGFVQILPGPAQVGTGGSLMIYAEATPASVTWTLTPVSGCSGSGCGTLSNANSTAVLYSGPAAISGSSASFTITATSTSNTSLSASQTYTIYPAAVQITGPSSNAVQPLTAAQFSAVVNGDPTTKGVTWSLSGASCSGNGLAYNNCGTLTNTTAMSATFTAPAAPAQETVILTAMSVFLPGTSTTYAISIPKYRIFGYTPDVLPAAVVGQAYSATVQVTGNTPPYTFSFANLPSWATVAPAASTSATSFTISGTPTAGSQGSNFIQLTVADSDTPPATASHDFTLAVYPAAASGNNLLNGSYAFYATGWLDGNTTQGLAGGGNAYQGVSYVGSFTADGNGTITGGEMDVNNFQTGLTSYAGLSGSYNIQYATDANNNQLPGFQTGYLTLIPPGNVHPLTLAVTFRGIQHQAASSLKTDIASFGDFIEFDDSTGDNAAVAGNSSGQRMAGTLALQLNNAATATTAATSVLNQASLPLTPGGYAFGMTGNTSQAVTSNACFFTAPPTCGPISLAGMFNVDGGGKISGGEEDVMVASNYNAATAGSLSGSFTGNGATDAFGRMTGSIPNANTITAGSATVAWPSSYIAYAIDSQHFYIMSADSFLTVSNLIGTATYQQPTVVSAPFNASQPMVLMSTVTSTQYFTAGGPNGKVRTQIQEFTPTPGASGCSGSQVGLQGPQYQDLSGTVTTATVGSIGTYCNTLTGNGRVLPASTSTGESEPILYLTDTNTGYGTQWNTGSGPGLWTALAHTANNLNAGNYSGSQVNVTSIVGPYEVDMLTLPTGGVPAGSSTKINVTGTDFSQFSIPNQFPGSSILYNTPFTGTMVNNQTFSYGGVNYAGIFPKAAINFVPSAAFQGCQSGFGFVVSPTSFVCIGTVDQFATPHLFQQ